MSLRSHATQRTVFVFVICAVLFLVLRLRWVGHLLTWDEAYNLCTVRTFVSGGEDFASDWFWRHPPLFCLLMMLVSPLSPGFAERVEILAIFVGLANLALLFVLNRQAFDTTTALWSVFLLSILPGSMFFDVWVKRDHLATTFGLIALILLFRKHSLYAGVSLGLALLCKESAAFFVIAALVLWGLGATGRRKISDCIALVAFTFLSCSWWYLVVKSKLHPMDTSQAAPFLHVLFAGVKEHLQFAGGEQSIWVMPWYDYFSKLPFLIGIPGLLLAGVGIVAILKTGRAQHPARVHPEESFSPRRRL
jgi:4-amino-4-deoxy-L-arabinose transferase-like glycosyltransferase